MSWTRYQDTNTKCVFIHLLLKACFDQCIQKNTKLSRGQYLTSLSELTEELNLSTRNVRTALKKLQDSGEISVTATNKYSLITVVKYEDYQINAVDTDKEIPKREIFRQPTKDSSSFSDQCLNQELWIETMCRINKTGKAELKNALSVFNLHLIATENEKSNLRDYKDHFKNWLRYNTKELVAKEGQVSWQWKGQSIKTGTMEQMQADKKLFDHPGFEFEIITQ